MAFYRVQQIYAPKLHDHHGINGVSWPAVFTEGYRRLLKADVRYNYRRLPFRYTGMFTYGHNSSYSMSGSRRLSRKHDKPHHAYIFNAWWPNDCLPDPRVG